MLETDKFENELQALTWAYRFQNYIQFRKQGLKKKAMEELEYFFLDFNLQSHSDRRFFIDIVNRIAFLTDNYSLFLPENLNSKFLVPEIKLWIKDEPSNPIPYKWSSNIDDNTKSVELDPQDQIALEKLVNRLIGKISMNQHELGVNNSYDGNPGEDIALINFLHGKLENLKDLNKKNKIYQILKELKECATSYIS